jgi:tripartite-type tricarboxylate transporter receptor subunit TctC
VEADTWYFLAAPKGTPAAIVNKLNQALNGALSDPKLKTRLEAAGLEAEPGTTPASVKAALQAEIDKWRPVVKAAGITIN